MFLVFVSCMFVIMMARALSFFKSLSKTGNGEIGPKSVYIVYNVYNADLTYHVCRECRHTCDS